MEFEWDDSKNRSNLVKHQVGFEVVYAFNWHAAIIERDDRYDYGEERYLARGQTEEGSGYSIVFTYRGLIVRIISVRPFNRKEELLYGNRE